MRQLHAVREYATSEDTLAIDVDCDCHGHMLRTTVWDINDVEEAPFFEISVWSPAGGIPSLWSRMKTAWRVIRHGYSQEDVFVCKTTAKNFANALLRACDKCRR